MATYDWGDTSQLEVLEVVHLTHTLLRICNIFAMSSTALLLNLIVHHSREGMLLVAVGKNKTKKTPQGHISDESKGDSLEARH